MSVVARLKRLVRPFVPDRVMARFRLRQHSRQVRVNVDVFVRGGRQRRRWLLATPDTYRVGRLSPMSSLSAPDRVPHPGDPSTVFEGDPAHEEAALAALGGTGAEAAVVATTSRPRLVGRRRTEPVVDPLAVAVSREALDEVGGVPGGDLVGLVRRLRDAGHRLALVPVAESSRASGRRGDPLDGPVVLLIAAVPMHDVGGGSRTAQLAIELVRRGVTVVYAAVFGSDEGTDLGLRFVHPRLEQYRLDEIEAAGLPGRASAPGWVLVAVPAPAAAGAARRLRGRGWRTCYDLIDDWSDPAIGGEWFSAESEQVLLREADAVVASAPDLVARAASVGRHATLLPNAVNRAVFGRVGGPEPSDLPEGDGPVIGYHGSLYGDWMDWASIERIASAHPEARVVLIGDDSKGHPAMPSNVSFLGLKPQADLPEYVRRFDVGLVPFRVTPTTHAVSPLKVFEYLACGVPVAAPPLRSLTDLVGVVTGDDLVVAVDGALGAPRPDPAKAMGEHSWERRAETLLDLMGLAGSVGDGTEVAVTARPVVHHPPRQRRI